MISDKQEGEDMRGIIPKILCVVCSVISLLLILFPIFKSMSETENSSIIGGADTPTFFFLLTQTLRSVWGATLCCTAVLPLILLIVLVIKDKGGRR